MSDWPHVGVIRTDYLVIGRGIAGLRAAIELSERGSVLVISKSRDTTASIPRPSEQPASIETRGFTALPRHVDQGSSEYAQGGVAVALNAGDSTTQHYQDTIRAGRGLCSTKAVEVLVTDGVRRVRELLAWGIPFDRRHDQLVFGRESAHRRPRILHAQGDATGEAILRTLLARLGGCRNVKFLNHHFTIDILIAKNRCVGAMVLDEADGTLHAITAKAVLLATGGAGQLYQRTTNPAVCTGDGMVIAYRAGATLQDLEFVQFHPTALAIPIAPAFLITEAIRGEGAIIRNGSGQRGTGRRFLFDYHRAGELAPRDIVARAIWTEMHRRRLPWVWLDASHLNPDYLRHRFPTVYATCLRHGLDLTKDAIPVSPAAHFFMGGIATDGDGASTISGLYAAGETACSGVHGANRLASNSLLEGLVFGWRAARAAIRQCGRIRAESPATRRQVINEHLEKNRGPEAPPPGHRAARQEALQALMWRQVGVVRDGRSLAAAVATMTAYRPDEEAAYRDRAGFEYRNLLILARLVTQAALDRRGSVGAHFRSDYPTKGRRWRQHQTATRPEESSNLPAVVRGDRKNRG